MCVCVWGIGAPPEKVTPRESEWRRQVDAGGPGHQVGRKEPERCVGTDATRLV